jgi:hypothetical protein
MNDRHEDMDLGIPSNLSELDGHPGATPGTGSDDLGVDLEAGLDFRSRSIASGLRSSLEPIVRKVVGRGGRPAALSRTLEIDRTLAARVLRAIRADDTVQVLQEIPAPNGLRIFLDAAARVGVDADLRARAGENVRMFEELIDEFPGGRSALDAALAEWDPSMRQRTERAAKQAMHKSMSCLLGYQVDTMLLSIIHHPSADGKAIDKLYVMGKHNIRRLRSSSPITVFGRQDFPLDPSRKDLPRVENLRGETAPRDAEAYLLREFCSPDAPALHLFASEGTSLYTLPDNAPAVNTPASYASAQMVRNAALRYRNDLMAHHYDGLTARMPAKVMLFDLYVHEDVFDGAAPTYTTTLHGLSRGVERPESPRFQLDRVEMSLNIENLGTGLGAIGTRDVPAYPALMRRAFDGAGWDPSRFRGYRCRVQYPVPLVSVTYWFDLPSKP